MRVCGLAMLPVLARRVYPVHGLLRLGHLRLLNVLFVVAATGVLLWLQLLLTSVKLATLDCGFL